MEKLLAILHEIRPDIDFTAEQDLIGGGMLDSLDIMEIVAEIGDAFGISLSPADIVPANFHSAEAMWEMIEKKKQRA